MTYTELIHRFLEKVQVIKSLNPAYKQPGDGSNGVCDCIGLIIGAIRRMGLKWTGIHGSNYAARYQTVNRTSATLQIVDEANWILATWCTRAWALTVVEDDHATQARLPTSTTCRAGISKATSTITET